jgi:hypothetical protein
MCVVLLIRSSIREAICRWVKMHLNRERFSRPNSGKWSMYRKGADCITATSAEYPEEIFQTIARLIS